MDEPHASAADNFASERSRQFGVKHLLFATAWIASIAALIVSNYDSRLTLVLAGAAFVGLSFAARRLAMALGACGVRGRIATIRRLRGCCY